MQNDKYGDKAVPRCLVDPILRNDLPTWGVHGTNTQVLFGDGSYLALVNDQGVGPVIGPVHNQTRTQTDLRFQFATWPAASSHLSGEDYNGLYDRPHCPEEIINLVARDGAVSIDGFETKFKSVVDFSVSGDGRILTVNWTGPVTLPSLVSFSPVPTPQDPTLAGTVPTREWELKDWVEIVGDRPEAGLQGQIVYVAGGGEDWVEVELNDGTKAAFGFNHMRLISEPAAKCSIRGCDLPDCPDKLGNLVNAQGTPIQLGQEYCYQRKNGTGISVKPMKFAMFLHGEEFNVFVKASTGALFWVRASDLHDWSVVHDERVRHSFRIGGFLEVYSSDPALGGKTINIGKITDCAWFGPEPTTVTVQYRDGTTWQVQPVQCVAIEDPKFDGDWVVKPVITPLAEPLPCNVRPTIGDQETFDIVLEGIRKQGRPSWNLKRGICAYRGEEGAKCAAGHLIRDEDYQQKLEGFRCTTQTGGTKPSPRTTAPRRAES